MYSVLNSFTCYSYCGNVCVVDTCMKGALLKRNILGDNFATVQFTASLHIYVAIVWPNADYNISCICLRS